MKVCLNCDSQYSSSKYSCSSCDHSCDTVDGFVTYNKFVQENDGFKAHYFQELFDLEAKNFWFRSRNKFIISAVKRYCGNLETFLEIGCGTGYVLSGLKEYFPTVNLYGSELYVEGLKYASSRVQDVNLIQMDARQIPFVDEFDCVGAFDVLEHIEEDQQVLNQIYKALTKKGFLILTVPQHKWLWSSVDEYACHKRRYSWGELKLKLEEAGFKVARSTSFVTTLLPVMYASRLMQRLSKNKHKPSAGLGLSPILNFIFEQFLNLELMIFKAHFNLSVGGSRLVVAYKK